MKQLIACIVFLISSTTFAKQTINDLAKRIELSIDGEQQSYTITKLDYNSAYYRANDYDLQDNVLKITMAYKDELRVELLTYKHAHVFKVDDVTKLAKGFKSEIVKRNHAYTTNYFEYFFRYETSSVRSETSLELKKIFATSYFDRVDSKGKYVSNIEYYPCDGCEHGDQFFISNEFATINVINMDFGDFYVPTCGEKLHPWLAQLFELEVPFMYYGTINAGSSDLWEGEDSHWMADKGQLTIGTKKENLVRRFLESLVTRAALENGEDPLKAWDTVIKNGRFISYQDGILTFNYADKVFELPIL